MKNLLVFSLLIIGTMILSGQTAQKLGNRANQDISLCKDLGGGSEKCITLDSSGVTELEVDAASACGAGNVCSGITGPASGTPGTWTACTNFTDWRWMRVGKVVTISGRCDVNTGAGGAGSCTWNTLPEKDANFQDSSQFIGFMRINVGDGYVMACQGVSGTTNVICNGGAGAPATNAGGICHFTYDTDH